MKSLLRRIDRGLSVRTRRRPPVPATAPEAPTFSILLPSRNRLELLGYAIETVRRQDFGDYEIIVADNCSDDRYDRLTDGLRDPRIRYSRSDQPLSVTANWNRALGHARGDYVVMLGDDDGLAPGFLRRMAAHLATFHRPDVIFCKAFHYCYPNVSPSARKGYLASLSNSILFQERTEPYAADRAQLVNFGRQVPRFRHLFGFNAQHFVWRRAFIEDVAGARDFFRPPYPDFYAAAVTFLEAASVVVDPVARMLIGISPRSFGFFYVNAREQDGAQQFLTEELDLDRLCAMVPAARDALALPGSLHYRNWLLAALQIKLRYADDPAVAVDLRRYRRIQIAEVALRYAGVRSVDRQVWLDMSNRLDHRERAFAERMLGIFRILSRVKSVDRDAAAAGVSQLLGTHWPGAVRYCAIGRHRTLLDAYDWLERHPEET